MTTEQAARRAAEKILGHIPVNEFRTMQHLNKTERIAAIILSELASLPNERDAGLSKEKSSDE